MRVREWTDIIQDVVESNAEPDHWRAVAGNRAKGLGEELYIGHPAAGLYLVKTYAKNPFEVKGVGTKVARKLDDELDSVLPDEEQARFAVRAAPDDERIAEQRARRLEETLRVHAEAPTSPEALFSDVMEALDSPAFGPLTYHPNGRPSSLEALAGSFEEANDLLDADLDDLIETDAIDRGFM